MNKDIQNRFLEHSNPNVVYDWLENNAYKLWAWVGANEKPEEELMLLERKEPLIDLALALFSHNKEIRNILFDRGDSTLQKAVLTNKNCGYFPELENLLKAKNTKYLEILLKNTKDRLFLVDLFKKQRIFDNVEKGYWLTLLEFAARNKILEYPYSKDDPEWEEMEEGDATSLYRSVYGLFNILEVTNKNADFLAILVQRLPATNGFYLVGIDELKLIKKWQNKKSVPHSDYLYFYEHKSDRSTRHKKFTKIEGKCWIERSYVICRTYLANFVISCDEFEDSEDIALRMAYYRNENFNQNEEKVLENWSKYRTRDGYLFIKNLIKNVSIYYNKKIREFIGEGAVLSRTYYVDEYLKKLKELQDNKPKYFIDNSQIEKIENIELELSSLKNDIHSINLKTEENKQMILSQRTVSFFIIFLLAVIILLSWL